MGLPLLISKVKDVITLLELFLFFIKKNFNVYLFIFERERERARERAQAGKGQRERERETQHLKQAPGSELSAQSLKLGLNS